MLTVYRASAGSGKTHLLTGTYIKMLFTEDNSFRNILAVTFTNKATEEMKHRIITQLHLLATDTEKSDYTNQLKNNFGLSSSEIREKAKQILIDILHNYSGFNVSTIDTFFQQTTRAFSRELGMQGGFNVELDTDKVVNEAIDNLINELDKPDNKQLLEWLIMFAEDNIDNGKNWNIRKDLFSLAREINKEDYKRFSEEIRRFSSDKKNFKDYIEKLKEIKTDFESVLREIGEQACSIMGNYSLAPSDFKGGKNSPFNYFVKWKDGEIKEPTPTFRKLAEGPENWTAKKISDELLFSINSAYSAGLNELVNYALNLFEKTEIYNSSTATLRYLYTLGILSDIDIRMRDYGRENNVMLISDTSELLNKIIDGKDNPFIYEKTGYFLHNFMIDEFQDTSGMQWDNFKPLINDSVSQMYDNLIVGDIKQSIYRWRNSDWNLLHSEIRNFNTGMREDRILGVNWRSCRAIVEFNNSFFTVAAELLQNKFRTETEISDNDTIVKAYSDIAQEVSPAKKNKEGHVRIEFLDAENKADYEENVLELLPSVIETMQAKGTSLKDIAILVRNSKEGALIAKKLLKYKEENPESKYRYDIISNDSLFIGQAKIIEAVISFMRFLFNDKERINSFIAEYNISVAAGSKNPEKALNDYFNGEEKGNEIKSKLYDKIPELRSLSLFELTEAIINIIKPQDVSLDNLFLQSFQDLVIEFCNTNSADLSSFLIWWDESGCKKAISSPDEQDAIKIITIHKSKGLGFDSVIIPFANWKIDHEPFKSNLIWCRPSVEPFNILPVVPIKYGKAMQNSIYKEDYFKEKLSAFIDNLNIAYVAFTRAKNELIIMAPKEKNPERLNDISSLLYSAFEWAEEKYEVKQEEYHPTFVNLKDAFDINSSVLEIGDWYECEKNNNKRSDIVSADYFSEDPAKRIQLRLFGKGRFNEGKERMYGTVMHDILSKISTSDEVEDAVSESLRSGIINSEQAVVITENLYKLISDPKVSAWFDPEITVMNEREILLPDGNVLRPDRIIMNNGKVTVIDYKFGNKISASYKKQVAGYLNQLWYMGYKNQEGYLWYVELGKIEKVEMQSPTLF